VRGLLMAYVLGAYVAALATILVYRTAAATARRFAAAGFDANELGTILALALPMAWYLGMTHRQPILRWICRGYLPIGLFALGLTASRGAMIVATVALLIVPLTMTWLSPAKMAGVILLLIACGTIGVAYIPERSLERLSSTKSEVEAGSLGGRGRVWKAGVLAFAQKPLMGYGTNGFKGAVSLLGYDVVAHNTYLTILVEQGLVGFLPWFMMFVAVFLQVRRLPPLERRFGLVLLATLGIAILPLTWDDKKPVWFILAVLAAYSEALLPGRVGAASVRQPRPLQTMPMTRQRMAPRARAHTTSRPSSTPTDTPYRDP
jgi:O-antigen ligase